MPDSDRQQDVFVIEPPKRWPRPRLGDLWTNRELIFFLLWRNIKVRYRQTVVGLGWSLLQPVVSMIVFTIIFSRVAKLPSYGLPYPVFVLSGLLPWIYFSNAVTITSHSLASNIPLITKVYFPRILIPVSSVLTPLVDMVMSLVVLIATMAIYRTVPSPTALLVPLMFVAVVLTALSVSIWLAALNVRYRDVGFVVPFLIQLWLFLTPVLYPGSLVPEGIWQVLYGLNPMVGIIEGFRWALVGTPAPASLVGPSLAVVVILLVGGWIYFLRTEQTFADVI